MAALDLGAATRTLVVPDEPFTSIDFGDMVFAPNPGETQPVVDLGGAWAIPRHQPAGAKTLWGGASLPQTPTYAIFIAVIGPLGTVPSGTGFRPMNIGFNSVDINRESVEAQIQSWFWDRPAITPPPQTVTVWCIANGTGTNARFFGNSIDGVLDRANGVATSATTANMFTLPTSDAINSAYVLGAWMFEGTQVSEADALDTMAVIAASFDGVEAPNPEAGAFSATTHLNIGGGAAEFSTEDPYEDPEPELPDAGGSVEPPPPPAPPVPPDYAPEPMRHVWQRLGAPNVNADGIDPNWMPSAEGSARYGRLQIVVEGVDITYYLGAATPEPDWAETEPFGWGPATIRLPQLTAFRAAPSWARIGANVLVRLIKETGPTVTLYQGVVMRVGDRMDSGPFTLECTGLLYIADLQPRLPSATKSPLDIGTAIPRALNAVVSRRYNRMASVVTGIRTSVSGGWEPTLTGYLANVLATAVKNGRQWTIHMNGRTPVLRRKNTTSTDWVVRAGQAGVTIDLGSDGAEARNVIYGSGINPDGGKWSNWKYPNMGLDKTPAYPNANPNKTHSTGARDSHTDSGRGISDWQRKAGLRVTGVLSAADVAAMRRLQRSMGINPDGWLGPQTWAATFKTGSNTGTFAGAFIAPLAAARKVTPRLLGPDGDDLGPNPQYNPNIIRVAGDPIQFGQGVWKSEGMRNARELLARDADPGIAGTITFDRVDPEQMHRYELRAGTNGIVRGWRGKDVRVHVASVSKRGQSVTLMVDSKARDLPMLKAILERDRGATDPARTARQRLLHGRIATDRPVFDAESPAGRIPRHPMFGGLWNVLRIPMGDFGRVVRTEFRTSGPAQRFSVAVFGKPVTANQLVARVGNPLNAQNNPWDKDLSDLGLLQAWGWNKQPAGYWPGTYSNPDNPNGGASPVTGRLVYDSAWDYASAQSPWLWVAMIAPSGGYIEGRLYGAAE